MAIDESNRHAMFTKLKQVLGDEHAAILMEHLPPVGWADVATKRDLDALRGSIEAALNKEMKAHTRTFVTWLLAGMGTTTAAVTGLAIAVLTTH